VTLVAVVAAELVVAVVAGVFFMVRYAVRSPWRSTPIGRHEMTLMAVIVVEALSLLWLALGVHVHPLVFVIGFGALDVVLIQRDVLLVRAQRRQPRE
jgi:hypothetical protein